MHRPPIVAFAPGRGDTRGSPRLPKHQHHPVPSTGGGLSQTTLPRHLTPTQLMINQPPPEDARLLDAAQTLVNLQQTTERQQANTSHARLEQVPRGQALNHTVRPPISIGHRNQIIITTAGTGTTPSSRPPIVTHLQTSASSTIPIARNPIVIQMVESPSSPMVVTSLGNPVSKVASQSTTTTHTKGIYNYGIYIYIYIYI